jgi:hypothetical protein
MVDFVFFICFKYGKNKNEPLGYNSTDLLWADAGKHAVAGG